MQYKISTVTTNKRILLKEFFKGEQYSFHVKKFTPSAPPILGSIVPSQTTVLDDSQTIDVENVSLNGGILLKTLLLSLEPYVIAKMRPGLPMSYNIGDTIRGYGVGVVVRSEDPAFQVGDDLGGFYPFEEYWLQQDRQQVWSPLECLCRNSRNTCLVIQLAKRDGMKVIASASSDDKVQFLKDLGADVAFNYKTTKTSEVLAKEGPIDVSAMLSSERYTMYLTRSVSYWDNVGGETLEASLNAVARYARFIRMRHDFWILWRCIPNSELDERHCEGNLIQWIHHVLPHPEV
ncbi:hypothetical protein J3R82DRAFT_7661 [Butyriboletus roseoflavus]|nr:hypothetical protein J3R82DRAFT_7661 [Butyriboletus roseoflavus]